MSTKVLVTGSRDLTDWQGLYAALDAVYEIVGQYGMIVIHGDARGADSFADAWAVFRSNVTVVRVPADWNNDGRGAGPIRNQRMLELNPEVVLAFFKSGAANRGTTHMTKIASEAGIPVQTYLLD